MFSYCLDIDVESFCGIKMIEGFDDCLSVLVLNFVVSLLVNVFNWYDELDSYCIVGFFEN